jgi:hypothetical protein
MIERMLARRSESDDETKENAPSLVFQILFSCVEITVTRSSTEL